MVKKSEILEFSTQDKEDFKGFRRVESIYDHYGQEIEARDLDPEGQEFQILSASSDLLIGLFQLQTRIKYYLHKSGIKKLPSMSEFTAYAEMVERTIGPQKDYDFENIMTQAWIAFYKVMSVSPNKHLIAPEAEEFYAYFYSLTQACEGDLTQMQNFIESDAYLETVGEILVDKFHRIVQNN